MKEDKCMRHPLLTDRTQPANSKSLLNLKLWRFFQKKICRICQMKPILSTAASATWQRIRNQEQQEKHSWEHLSQITCSGQDCAHTMQPQQTDPTAEHQGSMNGKHLSVQKTPSATSTAHLFILKEQQPPPLTFAPTIRTAITIFREALCTRHVSKQINKWEWVMHPALTEWHVWQLHSGSAWRNRLRE